MKSLFFQPVKKIIGGLVLAGAAFSAHAEYYMVYPASGAYYAPCGGCHCKKRCYYNTCQRCGCRSSCGYYGTPVTYIYSHAPRAYNYYGSGGMAAYAWIPTPEAP